MFYFLFELIDPFKEKSNIKQMFNFNFWAPFDMSCCINWPHIQIGLQLMSYFHS